ncbi:MAG: FeoA family protein [Candidatus Marinimicrobia bacterium]|nr:FeoA family protein [Candidatus Neomarinimicrobiota bacterium]
MNLKEIKIGKKVRIIKLAGGIMFKKRAEALGMRVGSLVEKRSAQFMNGPITIKIGNTDFALGIGMAEKIIVEEL